MKKAEVPGPKTPKQSPPDKSTAAITTQRERSRSPLDKKVETATVKLSNDASSSAKSNNTVLRYTGRPGEKKFSGRCRLFVANMNNNTTENELRNMFTPYGETGEVYINKDKGFGFIRLVSLQCK